MSGILLAAVLAAPPTVFDLVTKECHSTAQIVHGTPVIACEYRVWLVGMTLPKCRDTRDRIKKQLRGEVADSLDFKCLPEDAD